MWLFSISFDSLCCTNGRKKKHERLPRARPFFPAPIYFLAPAAQVLRRLSFVRRTSLPIKKTVIFFLSDWLIDWLIDLFVYLFIYLFTCIYLLFLPARRLTKEVGYIDWTFHTWSYIRRRWNALSSRVSYTTIFPYFLFTLECECIYSILLFLMFF